MSFVIIIYNFHLYLYAGNVTSQKQYCTVILKNKKMMTGNFVFFKLVLFPSALCNHLILLLCWSQCCCTFSMAHIERANEAMAVETLLVTDELFRLGHLP